MSSLSESFMDADFPLLASFRYLPEAPVPPLLPTVGESPPDPRPSIGVVTINLGCTTTNGYSFA